MKKNRIIAFFLVVMSMLTLTGCLEMADVSEEKINLVAEYSAGLLLRYSEKYEKRLITKEDLKKRGEEATPTKTPEAVVTEAPTESPAETPFDSGASTGSAITPTSAPTVSLQQIYNLPGVAISYKNYTFCEKYRDTASQVTAKEGHVLLVVSFEVKNNSSQKQKIQLAGQKIDYVLNVDDGKFSPGICILDNMGLNFLDTTLGAGKSEKAVLIFEMSKERRSAESIFLTVQNGNKMSEVKLK